MPTQLSEIKQLFRQEVRHIWGKNVDQYIEMDYVIVDDKKASMSMGGLKKRPRAIGNTMIWMTKKHTLYIAPRTLKYNKDKLLALIKHEVIHLGHPLYNKEFFRVCKQFGAMQTEDSYKTNLPPFKAQIKQGSRYKTINRFDDESRAYNWIKSYCTKHKIRGRIIF